MAHACMPAAKTRSEIPTIRFGLPAALPTVVDEAQLAREKAEQEDKPPAH